MREIKFRGKMISDNEWTYGNLVLDSMTERASIISWADLGESDKNGGAFVWDDVEFKTVGQYTGLKDKNSKEIYEGDIAKWLFKNSIHDEGTIAIWDIYWHDGGFSYGKRSEKYAMSVYQEWASRVEIIGNIYENPELLSKEQEDKRSVATKSNSSNDVDNQK